MHQRQLMRPVEATVIMKQAVRSWFHHDEMGVCVGHASERRAFLYLFGFWIKLGVAEIWLILQVSERAADVDVPVRSRRFLHVAPEGFRPGMRIIKHPRKLFSVVPEKMNRQFSNSARNGHISLLHHLYLRYAQAFIVLL